MPNKNRSEFLFYYLKNRNNINYTPPVWRLKSSDYEFVIGPIPSQEVSDSRCLDEIVKPFVTYLIDSDPKLAIIRRNGRPNLGDIVVLNPKGSRNKASCVVFTERRVWHQYYEGKGCEFTNWEATSITSPDDFGFMTVNSELLSNNLYKKINQT